MILPQRAAGQAVNVVLRQGTPAFLKRARSERPPGEKTWMPTSSAGEQKRCLMPHLSYPLAAFSEFQLTRLLDPGFFPLQR